jgi:hypothetical protein
MVGGAGRWRGWRAGATLRLRLPCGITARGDSAVAWATRPRPGGGARCWVLVSAGVSVIVRRVHEDELVRLTNHHASVAPVIEERPGRYLGYFENKFGEQLVFVHDDGEPEATVFLGDVGWEPRRVSDGGGLPDVGDLILNGEERAFVAACWIATAWRREAVRAAARHDLRGLPEAPGRVLARLERTGGSVSRR